MTDDNARIPAPPGEPRAAYRDRNRDYVPDGLFPDGGTKNRVLVGPSDSALVLKHGRADELNRDATWQWVQVSANGDPERGEHWSQFRGHHVLVDVQYRQANRREVNDWKGRDEIRAEGEWQLFFNRTQVLDGQCTKNVLADLTRIAQSAQRLLDHEAVDWTSNVPYRDQLVGRKVWYREVPAIVSREILSQGCVLLKPDGAEKFPPPVWSRDKDEGEYDDCEDDEAKVEILSPHIWWWRDR